MSKPKLILIALLGILLPVTIAAKQVGMAHSDPIAPVIFGVTSILFFAVVGRILARKLHQPTVLGELVIGIIIGNVFYWFGLDLFTILREGHLVFDIIGHVMQGLPLQQSVYQVLGNTDSAHTVFAILRGPDSIELLKVAHVVDVFSRYGVIFMLFLVGLDSSLKELRRAGWASLRVALIGVFAPMVLAVAFGLVFLSAASMNVLLFLAAALSATSITITARVLADLHQQQSKEAKVIVSAALIDDVLGLILLAIVTGIIMTGGVSVWHISKLLVLTSVFLIVVFLFGPYFLRFVVYLLQHMNILEAKLFISFLFVMMLAWTANMVGLATIVGAFAAGLILHDGYFQYWGDVEDHRVSVKDLVGPLESILAPLFFVLIGIQVKLETFMHPRVILLALGLLLAAIIGKIIAGWGAAKGSNRLAIGIGMIPRGEVGIVFASIGKSLGILSDELFSSIILMVMVTTLSVAPLLKWAFAKAKD